MNWILGPKLGEHKNIESDWMTSSCNSNKLVLEEFIQEHILISGGIYVAKWKEALTIALPILQIFHLTVVIIITYG